MDVARLTGNILAREDVEVMLVLCLDGMNNVKHIAEVSRGGLHGCAVSSRDILRISVIVGSNSFVLVHNHPSGDPTPSPEDIAMTKAVNKAAEIVGLVLLDLVIVVSETKYASLAELGYLS